MSIPRRSLFLKYILVFFFCFIFSLAILGFVLMFFQSRYFQDEKFQLLERSAVRAATITAENYAGNSYQAVDKQVLEMGYAFFASSVDAEIFLIDLNGKLLLGAGEGLEFYTNKDITPDIITQVQAGGYRSLGRLGNFFEDVRYVVGVPVVVENGATVGLMFASASASGFKELMSELSKMFLSGAVVVLFFAFIVIYVITFRLVRPLKDMLLATQSFAAGDFSKRVPVSGYDEIGQLAMAFNNMASTLATTETTRRSFIANVSHELKTPMTTIGGFLDGILDGTVPEEKRDQYLQVVSNEVKRLSRLVRSMLDTARIENGEMEVHPSLFDISEIIRQTVFSFEQVIEEKHIEVRGLEYDKVMVCADLDLMYQVVYNLVENAVKFVNLNGYIEVHYQATGQAIYVAIRNSGTGIAKSEVPQLFERFYKSDKSRSLNKDGVGLGLHIVKSIVNYHKGEIVVRSVEGEYTEFEFSIPVQPQKKISKDTKEIHHTQG